MNHISAEKLNRTEVKYWDYHIFDEHVKKLVNEELVEIGIQEIPAFSDCLG